MTNTTQLHVSEFTPREVGNRLFSIPLYQRLYAWETEQVKQLLEDLNDTYRISDGTQEYFIGNIVTSSEDNITHRNALIDGQQRITTFWLMGFVLKEYHKDWCNFILEGAELRLDFIARNDDRKFLEKLAQMGIADFFNKETLEEGVNKMMVNTINVIYSYFKDIAYKDQLAKYIYEKAKVVILKLPQTTDLNKYFEIMNNRGIQLEKHEILKARLIDKIWDEDDQKKERKRRQYALIWDACAQMNRDIEKSFDKLEEKVNIREEIRSLIKSKFNNLDLFIEKISSGSNKEDKTFVEILIEAQNAENQINENVKFKEPSDNFTSVVNFQSFLLHVYKIFKNEDKVSLKDKDLLKTIKFEKTDDNDKNDKIATSFISELFKLRILFDQYIIRSYKNEINNLWETRILPIEDDVTEIERFERKKAFDQATQILAMLNSSTSSEHWLTPVLKYLRDTPEIIDKTYTDWLENLDNCFAYTRTTDEKEMMVTANLVLANIHAIKPEGEIKIDINQLSRGVNTEHYWFYKLDYCLWKKWVDNEYDGPWKSEIKSFQFRSNRSVEHVYPQHPENGLNWPAEPLNSFGNLALISVSSNSGYNNQLPQNKKLEFQKRINNWGIESLKLADIYRRNEWNLYEWSNHQKDMINVLTDYHSSKK